MEAASTVGQAALPLPSRVTFANPPSSALSDVSVGRKQVVKKVVGVKPRSNNTFVLALVGIMFGLAIMYLVTRLIAMTRKMALMEKQLKQSRAIEAESCVESKPLPSGRCPVPLNTLFAPVAASPTPKANLPPNIPLPKNTQPVKPPTPSATPAPVAAPVAATPGAAPAKEAPAMHAEAESRHEAGHHGVASQHGGTHQLHHPLPNMPFPFPFPPFPAGMPGMMVMVDMPEMDAEMELEFASLFGAHQGVKSKSSPPRVEEVFDAKEDVVEKGKAVAKSDAAPISSTITSASEPEVQSIVDNALAPLGDVMAALENMTHGSDSDDAASDGNSSAEDEAPRRSTRGGRGGARTGTSAGGRGRGRGRGRAAAEK